MTARALREPPMVATGIATTRSAQRRPGPKLTKASSGFHSRVVGMLKLTLPLIASALILLVAAWPHLTQRDERFRIGVSTVSLEEATTVRMTKPRFTGIDAAERPYVMTADDALQQPNDPSVVELLRPKGDITLSNGSWIALMADNGNYYKDLKVLDAYGRVNVFHDSGYEFRTSSARFDMNAAAAEGNERVDGQGPFGTLVAQGFRVINRGAVVHFLGKSRMVIRRDYMSATR